MMLLVGNPCNLVVISSDLGALRDQGRGTSRKMLTTFRMAYPAVGADFPPNEEVRVTAGTGLVDPTRVRPPVARQEAGPELQRGPAVLVPDSPVVEPAIELGIAAAVEVSAPLLIAGPAESSASAGTSGSVVVAQLLNRAAATVRHHVENTVLRGADLSWTGYAVLALTCEERSIETRAAAAAIGISRGTLTGVVRTLESRNLVQRVPHCRDGRLVLLEPTTIGRRLARRLASRVAGAEDHAISCLDGGERDVLVGMLGRVVVGLTTG